MMKEKKDGQMKREDEHLNSKFYPLACSFIVGVAWAGVAVGTSVGVLVSVPSIGFAVAFK